MKLIQLNFNCPFESVFDENLGLINVTSKIPNLDIDNFIEDNFQQFVELQVENESEITIENFIQYIEKSFDKNDVTIERIFVTEISNNL
jgi:hypothetical protein